MLCGSSAAPQVHGCCVGRRHGWLGWEPLCVGQTELQAALVSQVFKTLYWGQGGKQRGGREGERSVSFKKWAAEPYKLCPTVGCNFVLFLVCHTVLLSLKIYRKYWTKERIFQHNGYHLTKKLICSILSAYLFSSDSYLLFLWTAATWNISTWPLGLHPEQFIIYSQQVTHCKMMEPSPMLKFNYTSTPPWRHLDITP